MWCRSINKSSNRAHTPSSSPIFHLKILHHNPIYIVDRKHFNISLCPSYRIIFAADGLDVRSSHYSRRIFLQNDHTAPLRRYIRRKRPISNSLSSLYAEPNINFPTLPTSVTSGKKNHPPGVSEPISVGKSIREGEGGEDGHISTLQRDGFQSLDLLLRRTAIRNCLTRWLLRKALSFKSWRGVGKIPMV